MLIKILSNMLLEIFLESMLDFKWIIALDKNLFREHYQHEQVKDEPETYLRNSLSSVKTPCLVESCPGVGHMVRRQTCNSTTGTLWIAGTNIKQPLPVKHPSEAVEAGEQLWRAYQWRFPHSETISEVAIAQVHALSGHVAPYSPITNRPVILHALPLMAPYYT